MTQFSSRPPFNDDPLPWTDPRGENRHGPYAGWSSEYAPRPEFARPQHNPTNPILADFREMGGDAQMWLDVIQSDDGDAFLAETPKEFGRVTADGIGHAIRVLTRLANLEDKEN